MHARRIDISHSYPQTVHTHVSTTISEGIWKEFLQVNFSNSDLNNSDLAKTSDKLWAWQSNPCLVLIFRA